MYKHFMFSLNHLNHIFGISVLTLLVTQQPTDISAIT